MPMTTFPVRQFKSLRRAENSIHTISHARGHVIFGPLNAASSEPGKVLIMFRISHYLIIYHNEMKISTLI